MTTTPSPLEAEARELIDRIDALNANVTADPYIEKLRAVIDGLSSAIREALSERDELAKCHPQDYQAYVLTVLKERAELSALRTRCEKLEGAARHLANAAGECGSLWAQPTGSWQKLDGAVTRVREELAAK